MLTQLIVPLAGRRTLPAPLESVTRNASRHKTLEYTVLTSLMSTLRMLMSVTTAAVDHLHGV